MINHRLIKQWNKLDKESWGRAGISFIKQLAKEVGAVPLKVNRNPSGVVDRGYVSGFLRKGNKFVYIQISDSSIRKDLSILYRIAENENDYGGKGNMFANVYEPQTILEMIKNIQKIFQ